MTNTTASDYDLDTSQMLSEKGYMMLEKLMNETSGNEWLEEIEPPGLGKFQE